jgi:UDP-galactopyranose mutase
MNLLLNYKDINNCANSVDELKYESQVVLNYSDKEVDTDIEEEYKQVWEERQERTNQILRDLADEKSLDLEVYVEKTFKKYHRINMTADSTLYYSYALNQFIMK